jgi:phosphate transport system substrate-binding protein
MFFSVKLALATLGTLSLVATAVARDYVFAVGSSTVFPFATIVAEQISRRARLRAPQVEAWGTGGGVKLFCQGVGAEQVDVALASREMTEEELARCAANGVGEILKLRVGSDGISFATPKGLSLELTLRDLYLALAKSVPGSAETRGELIANPYRLWSDIDPALPELPIKIYGPPLTSGTRDLLAEQGLMPGCRMLPELAELEAADPETFRQACASIREDGVYTTTGENDNLIVRKVAASDHAVGIFGFSYFDQNRDILQAAGIGGVTPSFETIHEGTYPLARPLYVYVKLAHLHRIPGLFPFLEEFVDARAVGEEGYLIDHGLVPVPEEERAMNERLLEGVAQR